MGTDYLCPCSVSTKDTQVPVSEHVPDNFCTFAFGAILRSLVYLTYLLGSKGGGSYGPVCALRPACASPDLSTSTTCNPAPDAK